MRGWTYSESSTHVVTPFTIGRTATNITDHARKMFKQGTFEQNKTNYTFAFKFAACHSRVLSDDSFAAKRIDGCMNPVTTESKP